MNEARTTSGLREILLNVLQDLKAGSLEPAQGHSISNVAGKILHSKKLDLEIDRFYNLIGKKSNALELGSRLT